MTRRPSAPSRLGHRESCATHSRRHTRRQRTVASIRTMRPWPNRSRHRRSERARQRNDSDWHQLGGGAAGGNHRLGGGRSLHPPPHALERLVRRALSGARDCGSPGTPGRERPVSGVISNVAKSGPQALPAPAPLLSALMFDVLSCRERLEGGRADHPRRRRTVSPVPAGPIFHVANREPRTGVPGRAASSSSGRRGNI